MSNSRWESARADGAVIVPAPVRTKSKTSSVAAATREREINVADEIIDGLWMGSVNAGKMAATGLGEFDAIVNLTGESTDWAPKIGHNKAYIHFQFGDGDLPDLNHLDALVEHVAQMFILAATTDKPAKVLVHCFAGVNRSGLVCALVVRRLKGLSGMEALRLVREKRDLKGNDFFSPGTKESGTVACFNSIFSRYVESLS